MACEDQVSSADLENAKLDTVTIAEVATSRTGGEAGGALIEETTTRFGDTASTIRGQLLKFGYLPPVAYAGSVVFLVDDGAKTIERSGIIYSPLIAELPFTTSGTWTADDENKFRLVQVVSAPNAVDVPYSNVDSSLVATNVKTAIDELDSNSIAGLALKADLTGAAFTSAVSVAGALSSTAGNVNLKTNTALSDAAATLTAAQLIGGEFTITPTVARIQTTDTAANIIAALGGSVDGSNFDFTMINLDAFDVTIAAGTGVTIVGNMIVNDGSATFNVRRTSSSTVSVTRLDSGGSSSSGEVFIANDTKTSGTDGGTSAAGTQIRAINTVLKNTISGASLSSNQITLPAGEYTVLASAPCYRANQHQAWLTNVTDTTDDIIGSSESSNSTNFVTTRSFVDGSLSLAGTKVFSLTHYTLTLSGPNGLGLANASGKTEIYSQIRIEKIG